MPIAIRLAVMPRAVVLLITLMILTAFTAATLTVGSSLMPSTPLPPTGLARNGLIVWDNNGDIWVADPDGSNPRPFVTDPEIDIDPTWSPDGTHLAFWALTDPAPTPPSRYTGTEVANALAASTAGLVVVDASGSDRRVVADGIRLDWRGLPPAWAPDGRRLAFSDLSVDATSEIHSVSIDNPGTLKLIGLGVSPTWSPDGTSIAYLGGTGDSDAGVYVRRLGEKQASRVSSVTGIGSSWAFTLPQWSPDGVEIVFYAGSESNYDVWVANADGSGDVAIGTDPTTEFWPAWSPDGTRIAFGRNFNDPRFVVTAPDGSNPVTLRSGSLAAGPPTTWAPDGSRLIGFEADPTIPNVVTQLLLLDTSGVGDPVTVPVDSPGWTSSWQRLAP